MNINLTDISNISVDGVDPNDYPDYCDAYISDCEVNGFPATEEQLYYINETFPELTQQAAHDYCISWAEYHRKD